jgi:hypothetical protein
MATWQDLVDDDGFPGRYASVRHFEALEAGQAYLASEEAMNPCGSTNIERVSPSGRRTWSGSWPAASMPRTGGGVAAREIIICACGRAWT